MKAMILVEPSFKSAFQKLVSSDKTPKARFKLVGVSNKIDEHGKNWLTAKDSILLKYCKKNEDGSPLVGVRSAEGVFTPGDGTDVDFELSVIPDLNKELADLSSIEVQLEHISIDDIATDSPLTEQDFAWLGEIVQ